jgi:hypothetical protein
MLSRRAMDPDGLFFCVVLLYVISQKNCKAETDRVIISAPGSSEMVDSASVKLITTVIPSSTSKVCYMFMFRLLSLSRSTAVHNHSAVQSGYVPNAPAYS